jgi:hypothetical protein
VDTSKLTPGVIVILAAGLITLIFSFFAFYSFDPGGGRAEDAADEAVDACRDQADAAGLDPDEVCGTVEDVADIGSEKNYNAWTNDTDIGLGLFPVATLPAIFGLLMAVQIGLAKLANVKFPERVLGLGWGQIHLALGFNAALLMLAFLVRDKGQLDFGFGFYIMLIGSLALVVGAVLFTREEASGPAVPPPPPPAAPPTA